MTPFELLMLVEVCTCAEPGVNMPGQWDSPVGRLTRMTWQGMGMIDGEGRGTVYAEEWLRRICAAGDYVKPVIVEQADMLTNHAEQ